MRPTRTRPRLSSRAFAALRLLVACLVLVLAASPTAREGALDGGAGTWLIDPIAWVAVSSPRVVVDAVEGAAAPSPAPRSPEAASLTSEARDAAPRSRPRYLELCRFLL